AEDRDWRFPDTPMHCGVNMPSGSVSDMDRDYGHGGYGGPRSMDSYLNQSYGMESHGGGGGGGGGNRFGPYESYDSGSSLGGRDLYRSGYGYNEPEQSRFGGSYGGRRNQGGSSWEAPYSRSKLRPGFMEDRGRESYSSYSSFSSPHMKPAPVGSRGRGTPAYPESGFGSRNYDAFGGPSTGRGRGRGHMGDFGGMHRPGIVVDYHNKPSPAAKCRARSICTLSSTRYSIHFLSLSHLKNTKYQIIGNNEIEVDTSGAVVIYEDFTRDAYDLGYQTFGGKSVCFVRMAFTCSFCKFRTFEEKEIESHLESAARQETLDHIQKQTKFDKVVMEFLHECMVNKFKKTAMRKQQTSNQTENSQAAEKDIMEG
ncbi:ZN326 protein, partial [Oxylabes madagascariensis]|nr:ZN326 protein [Oxylabes madagascariensis]